MDILLCYYFIGREVITSLQTLVSMNKLLKKDLIMYIFSRLAYYWLHILSRHSSFYPVSPTSKHAINAKEHRAPRYHMAGEKHSHNAISHWNFQKYSVKIIYAIIYLVGISKPIHSGILINIPYMMFYQEPEAPRIPPKSIIQETF